jgi:hypothetical protein
MRKHLPLVIGFAIPILLVVAVVLSIYVPRLTTKGPSTNFLFMSRQDYTYPTSVPPMYEEGKGLGARPSDAEDLYDYRLQGDRLEIVKVTDRGYPRSRLPALYRYDVEQNTYAAVSEAELSVYRLQNSKTSPDGFEINSGSNGGGIFEIFSGSRDYYATYITKGAYSKKLSLPSGTSVNTTYCYDLNSCGFVGWIIGEK